MNNKREIPPHHNIRYTVPFRVFVFVRGHIRIISSSVCRTADRSSAPYGTVPALAGPASRGATGFAPLLRQAGFAPRARPGGSLIPPSCWQRVSSSDTDSKQPERKVVWQFRKQTVYCLKANSTSMRSI